jgi:hypothetical protein
MALKVLAAETTLTAATNVSTATVVRVINTSTAAAVVTRKDSAGATIGSFTMAANEVAYVEKEPTDTLEGGAAFKASKVAYSN